MIYTIDIGREFSRSPSGRIAKDGPHNGTRFREEFLRPQILSHKNDANFQLLVVLDNAEGYGSSFLDEAFAGIIRSGYCTKEQLKRLLKFSFTNSEYKFFEDRIYSYIDQAKP